MKKTTVKRVSHGSSGRKRTSAKEEQLRARVLEEAFGDAMAKRLAASECLPHDVLAYLVNIGDQKLLEALGSHADGCGKCRNRLQELKKGLEQKGSLDLDIPGIVQQDKFEIGEDALTMIVKANKDFLKLLKHTGEQVSHIPGIFGNINMKDVPGKTVIVRKDMPSYDLSVHVAMSGTENTTRYEARFCAMKPDIGQYIKDLNVSLTAQDGGAVKRRTDERGCAEFDGMKKGRYEIWSGDKLIASIIIK